MARSTGCGDSRIPPELSAKFGGLFIVRDAGRVISPSVRRGRYRWPRILRKLIGKYLILEPGGQYYSNAWGIMAPQ
jgi:hypothetical protein